MCHRKLVFVAAHAPWSLAFNLEVVLQVGEKRALQGKKNKQYTQIYTIISIYIYYIKTHAYKI